MRWLQAYKSYVKTLLTRKNTITGIVYSEDPTVFAWELANEPQTSADYEINQGIKPGSLVYDWLDEMSAYVKGLAPNHMVRNVQAGCRCYCCYYPVLLACHTDISGRCCAHIKFLYLTPSTHILAAPSPRIAHTHGLACPSLGLQGTEAAPEGARAMRVD